MCSGLGVCRVMETRLNQPRTLLLSDLLITNNRHIVFVSSLNNAVVILVIQRISLEIKCKRTDLGITADGAAVVPNYLQATYGHDHAIQKYVKEAEK